MSNLQRFFHRLAALSNTGTPYHAFVQAVSYPNRGMVCEQNNDEMRRIFNRKFPQKIQALEAFLSLALLTLEVVPTPAEEHGFEEKIRDVKDRPILRAAIYANADILLTFVNHMVQLLQILLLGGLSVQLP